MGGIICVEGDVAQGSRRERRTVESRWTPRSLTACAPRELGQGRGRCWQGARTQAPWLARGQDERAQRCP